MMLGKTALSFLLIVSTPSIVIAQNNKQNSNKPLEQLKDVNRTSTEAAGIKNPERSKATSNQNIDTRTPPAVRAAPPSNQSKAERDAAAIKAYTSKPATGQDQLQRIQRKKIEVPPPGAARAATPVKPVTPQPARLAPNATPARAAATPASPRPAPVAAAPKPAPVAPKPAPVAAAPRPAPVASAPVRASTPTVTTSSSTSTSSAAPTKRK